MLCTEVLLNLDMNLNCLLSHQHIDCVHEPDICMYIVHFSSSVLFSFVQLPNEHL